MNRIMSSIAVGENPRLLIALRVVATGVERPKSE